MRYLFIEYASCFSPEKLIMWCAGYFSWQRPSPDDFQTSISQQQLVLCMKNVERLLHFTGLKSMQSPCKNVGHFVEILPGLSFLGFMYYLHISIGHANGQEIKGPARFIKYDDALIRFAQLAGPIWMAVDGCKTVSHHCMLYCP